MKGFYELSIIAGIAALFVIGMPLLFQRSLKEYDISIVVTGNETNIGISTDKTFDFGRMPVGSSVKKEIVIENDKESRVKAIIKASGNVSKLMSFNKSLLINGNERAKVPIEVKALSTGKFTGKLSVEVKSARFAALESLVSLS